ncbi:peptide deformylase [bacterium]|nr:peptide deformylase [bacterium]
MNIIVYPNLLLRKVSEEISSIDKETIEFIAGDFFDTMLEKDGIGLAAPQVGILKRFFAINIPISEDESIKKIVINPKILSSSKTKELYEEGCLSVPLIYALVERPISIKVSYMNEEMKEITEELDGLSARVFQHEFDHLNGILFINKLSNVELLKIKKALKELKNKYKNDK